jgi:hypothetical protein
MSEIETPEVTPAVTPPTSTPWVPVYPLSPPVTPPLPPVVPAQLILPFDQNTYWTASQLGVWWSGRWELANAAAYIYGQALVPPGVTSANLRLAIAANATAGVTRMALAYTPVANGEQMNFGAWLTTLASQDITVPGVAYQRKDVVFALTGLVGADLIEFMVFREGNHANDTLTVPTLLFGAWLEPTG